MLLEYALIPDIFDASFYGKHGLDKECQDKLLTIYLKKLKNILLEDCIIRNIGGQWAQYMMSDFTNQLSQSPIQSKGIKEIQTLVTAIEKDRLNRKEAIADFSIQTYDQWCQEAIESHTKKPLSGIITSKKTFANCKMKAKKKGAKLFIVEHLDDQKSWLQENHSPSLHLRKNTEAYLKHLDLIFQYSSKLMFIDPYLNSRENDLDKLFKAIPETTTIQIHVSLSRANKEEYKKNFTNLLEKLNPQPKMEIFLWDDFHDRYLISNLIGISLPYGFTTGKGETIWTKLSRQNREDIERKFEPEKNNNYHKFLGKLEL